MRGPRAVLIASALLALITVGGPVLRRPSAPARLAAAGEPVRIEVRRPREDLILAREPDGRWLVERQNDLADAEAVDLLLQGLSSLEFGPPIAPAAAGLAHGLGPADSARVRVLDQSGRPLFDGQFGRRLFGRSAYFRAADSDPVRMATGLDGELLTRASGQWREPRLLPGGCSEGLEVSARGSWRPVSSTEAAGGLCALRASHWAEGAPEGFAGFERPLLRARTRDGRGFTVGERRGGERLVRVDGRRAQLRIPAAAIEAMAADLLGSSP